MVIRILIIVQTSYTSFDEDLGKLGGPAWVFVTPGTISEALLPGDVK